VTTKLSILVVSYNVRDLLAACLRSTVRSLEQSPSLQADIWVVDNASSDGSCSMVRQQFPSVHLVPADENLGFAGGNNLALRSCGFVPDSGPSDPDERPDLVLLLNADAEPRGDAVGRMAQFLKQNQRAGAAGANLEYADGSFQHGAYAFPGLLQLWFDLFPPRPRRLLESALNGRYPRRLYEGSEPFPVGFALGACLMVRKEAIDAVGLLDESYFMYAEEVDWCWRMSKAGWPTYCVPDARVVHHGGASARQVQEQSTRNLWLSRKRLNDTVYNPLQRWLAYHLVVLGMKARSREVVRAAERMEIPLDELDRRLALFKEILRSYRETGD
jgi:N-acetylglucosaminyl-diphospho-decaprenol L-rhamnosyltransferase